MTPLQQAAQAVIARWDSPKWKDEAPTAVVIGALLKALTDEQAQAVEPVNWKAHIQTARNVYSDYLDVQEALNYLEQVFLAAKPAPQATTTRPLALSEKSELLAVAQGAKL